MLVLSIVLWHDGVVTRSGGAMHVAVTRRQHNGKVYETYLLRRSFREDGKVKNETLANLSHLPVDTIRVIRESLAGKAHVVAGEGFDIERSLPHGHVAAVWAMAAKLGLEKRLGPVCVERDVAMVLIVARACKPASKLATTRWWMDTTLACDLGVGAVSTDEVYAAMDWLVGRQGVIESGLVKTHLGPGSMVLYDLSSSWVEGSHCPLAARGYSRDHKAGKAQIEYGLMTDTAGRPLSIEVFPGNTADPTAFIAAVEAVRGRFGLKDVIMVGDRGMITTTRIEALRDVGGLDWVTCLRAPSVKALAESGALQLSLFDQANLAEISHPDYPGERLIACRNPTLATERARKRSELLAATETVLAPIVAAVNEGRLKGADKIGIRIGRHINRYKMAKHFTLEITDTAFTWTRKTDAINAEAALDGIYVIRTSVSSDTLDTSAAVAAYKNLAVVERDFRNIKTMDLDLRPIYHRTEDRVRAHVFICMLAGYITWHLRQVWAPLCFTDEQRPERVDPVAPAQQSAAARQKALLQTTTDNTTVHNFSTLLNHLATLTRNTIKFVGGSRIDKLSLPTRLQRQAFDLIGTPIPTKIGNK